MIEKQLLRSIMRSESAYAYYLVNKRYHQALRIFEANQTVYGLLCVYSLECSEEIIDLVYDYIFHLEDWFAQFKHLEKSNPNLEDTFVFGKLEYGIAYPKDFKQFLNI